MLRIDAEILFFNGGRPDDRDRLKRLFDMELRHWQQTKLGNGTLESRNWPALAFTAEIQLGSLASIIWKLKMEEKSLKSLESLNSLRSEIDSFRSPKEFT